MPISMVDYAHLIKDPMTLGLYKNLLRMGNIVKLFPVAEVGSMSVRAERWATLPTHGFRKMNSAGFTASTGTLESEEDRLAIFGGEFTSDKVLKKFTKVPLLRDPVQQQFDMHSKALERGIAYNLFMGNIGTTPDGFDGLLARFTNVRFPARQIVDCGTDATSMKVLTSEATARAFFGKLDEAIKYAGLSGGGSGTEGGSSRGAIFMNETAWIGFQNAARLAAYSIYTKDILGYQWDTYKGLPLVDVGYQRDMATEIVGNAYATSGDSTYLFVVRFSEADNDIDSPGSDGVTLVQAGGMETLGPEEYNTYSKYAMQWVLGMAHAGDDYCASLLRYLKFAAT